MRAWGTVRRFSAVPRTLAINGKSYRLPPATRPVVAICLDGTSQAYLDAATQAGVMPCWSRIVSRFMGHTCSLGTAAMPTLSPNNGAGIVTGLPPKGHGITGSRFYDRESGQEGAMTADHMRCDTILSKMSQEGVQVTVLAADQGLLQLLAAGLDPERALAVSMQAGAEGLAQALQAHGVDLGALMAGRPVPAASDPQASLYLLEMGLRLLQSRDRSRPSIYYLSASDALQHQHGPGSPEAQAFYSGFDALLGQLDLEGALVGVTAGHGMNEKHRVDRTPKVAFCEPALAEAGLEARVLLPIADEAGHRSTLGAYATVYLQHKEDIAKARTVLRALPGVYQVIGAEDAALALQLPLDRFGDLIVLGDQNSAIGSSPAKHDLEACRGLRSHGGLEEQVVPMFLNQRLEGEPKKRLGRGKSRNYDLFDLLLNGVPAPVED